VLSLWSLLVLLLFVVMDFWYCFVCYKLLELLLFVVMEPMKRLTIIYGAPKKISKNKKHK